MPKYLCPSSPKPEVPIRQSMTPIPLQGMTGHQWLTPAMRTRLRDRLPPYLARYAFATYRPLRVRLKDRLTPCLALRLITLQKEQQ
ncbi:hypothetical protein TcasGA2_TC002124 [Tribolium castaneum]|uniref:Uncharacterized protein n=1 Tax=Tribolium castaneum TaxID=7070 RepID=D6WGR2_TRICA|nr:hypothetical protein TcasGA2_TC002124 [Tribolium castaneum]